MTYFEECIYKFNNLPQQNQDAFGSIAVLQKINTLENKYKINLGFMAILIAIGELEPTDIAEYIEKKYKLKKVKAEKISSDFDAQVINPAIKNTIGTPQGFSLTTLTLQEEKELIIKFFKEEFVDILKGSPDRQNAINLRIFYVLSKDGNFNKELETALYNNKQKATHKTFKLDNNSKTPSVGNWLRYFIKENSTANFNEITLLKFLLNSPNTKILDSNERELLNTILKTYRNIKFFPESMPSDTNIKWEIIPIIRTALISERKLEEGLTKIPKKKLGVPGEAPKEIIEEEQNENEAVTEGIQDILAAEDNLKESEVEEAVVKDESTIPRSIESLIDKPTPPIAPEIEDTLEEEEEESAIEIPITIKEPVAINKPGMDEIATEEIIKEEPIIEVIPKKPKVIVPPVIEKPKNKNPRTKELEDMAAMYPKGSMERKAIEEEIKKLEI